MTKEQHTAPWLLQANLDACLASWQRKPDSEDELRFLEVTLDRVFAQGGLIVKLKKEILDIGSPEERALTMKQAETYGSEEGGLLVFESSQDLKLRVGQIKDKTYLFLDSRVEKTIGFIRPEYIVSWKFKK